MDNDDELKQENLKAIRTEVCWLSTFLVKIPLIIGVLCFLFVVLFSDTGSREWNNGYTVVMETRNADGLIRQAEVNLAGVPIGHVNKVELNSHNNGTLVHLYIYDQYQVHEGDSFSVASRGWMGDQYVSVKAATERGPKLREGDHVTGKAPMNLEKIGELISVLVERLDNDMLNKDPNDKEQRDDSKAEGNLSGK